MHGLFTDPDRTPQYYDVIMTEMASQMAGNSPVNDEFPAQRASNAENVFIQWRHYASKISRPITEVMVRCILLFSFVQGTEQGDSPHKSGLISAVAG